MRLAFLSLALIVALGGCGQDSGYSYTKVSSVGDRTEAVLVGMGVAVEAAGDKVEIRDGSVFVNGTSYGAVESGEEVQYTVTPEGRILSVEGEVRAPAR